MCTCRVVVYCKIHAHCGGERGRCLASHHCESINLYLMFYHSLETLSLPYLIIIYRLSFYHKIIRSILLVPCLINKVIVEDTFNVSSNYIYFLSIVPILYYQLFFLTIKFSHLKALLKGSVLICNFHTRRY